MDVRRPELARKNRLKKRAMMGAGAFAFVAVCAFLIMHRPGPYQVDQELVFRGIVNHGEMKHELHGVGTLEPEQIRWISARSAGRVERVLVLPGAQVSADTVIMELSNPELSQQKQNAELQLLTDEANFLVRKAELQSSLLQSQSSLSRTESEFKQTELDASIDQQLFERGLESEQAKQRSALKLQRLKAELALEKQRYELAEKSIAAQLHAQESLLEQSRARLALLQEQADALSVKAGFDGLLQQQTLKEGQQVSIGQSLAQVVNPNKLRAEIKVSEHQAKRLTLGLKAGVDTRSGIVKGFVHRIDPNVVDGMVAVDIKISEDLPKGIRPNSSIEASIEIQRINNVVYVDRPIYARAESHIKVFRFIPGSDVAEQVKVLFGRTSINTIEVVDGLKPGDEIILSDTTDWSAHSSIRVN
ncbi:HlyD family secretion protein [Agaribacterium sp. ZY112]|uniref:HlyD family secretion protein n=1 Tax=Agaribacterium sp. ZY112 TaxID=3233574 RepID=UPI0035268D0B